MTDPYTNLLYTLAGVTVTGGVGWIVLSIIKLNNKILELRLEIAEKFVKYDDLSKVDEKVDRALEMMIEICGKMGIPVPPRRG